MFAARFSPGEIGATWDEVHERRRDHDGQSGMTFDELAADIVRYGVLRPVLVDTTTRLVKDGHHRAVVAIRAGLPVPWLDFNEVGWPYQYG